MNLISSAAGRRVVRLGVLILGAAMLIYGAQRGEAATVLSKACLLYTSPSPRD